jgi:hypothetical protein
MDKEMDKIEETNQTRQDTQELANRTRLSTTDGKGQVRSKP